MIQSGCGLYLMKKPVCAEGFCDIAVKDFQCDEAIVSKVLREIHRCHATATQLTIDSVVGA
jgi:hypothetical protein